MSTIIKLQRQGAPHRPFWRIVVTDSRKPKGCISLLGTYDNINKPVSVNLNSDKTIHWLSKGALPTPSVKHLLLQKGLLALKGTPSPKRRAKKNAGNASKG